MRSSPTSDAPTTEPPAAGPTASPPSAEELLRDEAPRRRRPPLFRTDPTQLGTMNPPPEESHDDAAGDSAPPRPADGSAGAPPRSGRRGSSPFARRELEAAVEAGVGGITTLAHETLTRDELERDAGLYLADEQDLKGIAKPVAGIMARRAETMEAIANPDLSDAIAAAVALAVYLTKQLRRVSRVRRARAAGISLEQLTEAEAAAAAAPEAAA